MQLIQFTYNGLGYWDPDTNNVGGSAASPYVNWFTVNIALPLATRQHLLGFDGYSFPLHQTLLIIGD